MQNSNAIKRHVAVILGISALTAGVILYALAVIALAVNFCINKDISIPAEIIEDAGAWDRVNQAEDHITPSRKGHEN